MLVNPYERLKEQFKKYVDSCEYRKSNTMFVLNKNGSYSMSDIYERILAANQLGHDVQLFAKDGQITIKYIENIPRRPWVVR